MTLRTLGICRVFAPASFALRKPRRRYSLACINLSVAEMHWCVRLIESTAILLPRRWSILHYDLLRFVPHFTPISLDMHFFFQIISFLFNLSTLFGVFWIDSRDISRLFATIQCGSLQIRNISQFTGYDEAWDRVFWNSSSCLNLWRMRSHECTGKSEYKNEGFSFVVPHELHRHTLGQNTNRMRLNKAAIDILCKESECCCCW